MNNNKKETPKTSVQISLDLHEKLKAFCGQSGQKLTWIVEKSINEFISGSKQYEKKEETKKLLLD